mmetsp:Transcript_11751/g.17797  ORF Transcript_11751/g.17797 Transcript_11751/m.17797 type:complete len:94 (+) Transcript_11751:1830-2111(+)
MFLFNLVGVRGDPIPLIVQLAQPLLLDIDDMYGDCPYVAEVRGGVIHFLGVDLTVFALEDFCLCECESLSSSINKQDPEYFRCLFFFRFTQRF